MKSTDRDIAEQLCIKYGIRVQQARYREDGRWYHHLTAFPAAFLDKNGYIIFPTRAEYLNCQKLDLQKDVNIPDKRGIKSITGYTRFPNDKEATKPFTGGERVATSEKVDPAVSEEFDEGGTREVAMEMQRRSPQLRRLAIKRHGAKCQACGFEFGEIYGDLGHGFIELHHLVPLSLRRQSQATTLEDVAVVCSNCHRMLHRNGIKPISVEELRKVLTHKRKP